MVVTRRQEREGGNSDDHKEKGGWEVNNGEMRRVRTRSGREKSVEAQRNGSTGTGV
jgi:hypothetical protein